MAEFEEAQFRPDMEDILGGNLFTLVSALSTDPTAFVPALQHMLHGKVIEYEEKAKEDFLKGAKIAYETIITNFASGNLKNIKHLLDKKVFDQFNEAIKEKKDKGYKSETTFIGISSASIKEHNKLNNILEVTVDYVSEIISCVKDKNNKILSGNPEKVKKVFDTWKFSKNIGSNNPNWLLIDTQI